ncbi:hypothetical protein JOF29_008709 [Kribbella aluminosa]|uniref:Uncharacterized protein n=1 Tax=Kribbella aluminosa TaxID=416017 RepID=A0ABS4V111_9ACTN|nr:hypothetical protein [Kribbella aluminosa]MBP2357599.1 hypothetical protein [Kribbella aluminosa]
MLTGSQEVGALIESGRSLPRRFLLVRHKDISGVSGTGLVAEGTLWSSGAVALHWPGHPSATSVWSGILDLIAAHGHDGATEIEWIDDGPDISASSLKQPKQPERDSKGWPILNRRECIGVGE